MTELMRDKQGKLIIPTFQQLMEHVGDPDTEYTHYPNDETGKTAPRPDTPGVNAAACDAHDSGSLDRAKKRTWRHNARKKPV